MGSGRRATDGRIGAAPPTGAIGLFCLIAGLSGVPCLAGCGPEEASPSAVETESCQACAGEETCGTAAMTCRDTVDCDDGDPCTVDSCSCDDAGRHSCLHTPSTEPLDDGDACTVDACVDGVVEHERVVGGETWRQCATDITFIAMGDTQYGGGAADKNTFQITALNAFAGTPWPAGMPGAGEPVAEPLGVLIAGDLTQNGRDGRLGTLGEDQIGAFETDYGLTGSEGSLHYPVYEGYGNHDFDPDEPNDDDLTQWQWWYTEDPTPAVDRVAQRNEARLGLTRVAPGPAGHYSWDWGNVHLLNLNLFPGDEPSNADENALVRDPRGALTWMTEELATQVGSSGRPIVLMFHYGVDAFGTEARWWTDEQRAEFLSTIDGYNIIAIIHGHTHATFLSTWEGYNVFNVGSPYYLEYNADGQGHFTVFRITDTFMAVHDVGWSPEMEGADPHFTGWSHVSYLSHCMPETWPNRCD